MHDRYGEYYLLTGHEAPRRCFWCGIEVNGRQRYCCDEHHEFYLEHFHWPEAQLACLRRQNHSCADCLEGVTRIAHHIEPLDGRLRLWNILNRPENLVGLCTSCHRKRHTRLESTAKEDILKPDIYELAIQKGQLIFEELI